jgi:uncharacterized phage protein (TIGR02218 family)
MSFDAFEVSLESGQPVEVYTFQIGTDTPYRYTSAEDEVTVGGNTYIPKAIKSGKTQEGGQKTTEYEIELPGDDPFVLNYAQTLPGKLVTVTVTRYHRADLPTPELRTFFDGSAESVQWTENGHRAKVTARPRIAASGRVMPIDGYQSQCNNVLYEGYCQANPNSAANRLENASVVSSSGRTLTVAGAAAFPDGWFQAGRASIDGESDHRMIISHVGNTIELLTNFPQTPTLITLRAGCAHTLPVCVSKFAQGVNFRGFHAVPTRNPFTNGVL